VIGLPSLQALDSASGPRIWLAAEAADMRCGFDRLACAYGSILERIARSGEHWQLEGRLSANTADRALLAAHLSLVRIHLCNAQSE
jgi:hypothetical protein